MPKLIIGSRNFEIRKLREAKDTGEQFALRRDFATEIKAVEGDERSLDFTISTEAVDRYGDTIAADGWKLQNYKKNPVVLWMHNNMRLPVAKARDIRIEGGKLKARAEFTPAALDAFNDQVLAFLKGAFLSATSVGFLPLKYNFVDDPSRRFGIDFIEQELLEFSIVTVPANPEALIEGRGLAGAKSTDTVEDGALAAVLERERLKLLKLRAVA